MGRFSALNMWVTAAYVGAGACSGHSAWLVLLASLACATLVCMLVRSASREDRSKVVPALLTTNLSRILLLSASTCS
ncbi:hypothetical protein COO60DRAFT_1546125, partial [Scenedesmus sp. NREL 46B-D3]